MYSDVTQIVIFTRPLRPRVQGLTNQATDLIPRLAPDGGSALTNETVSIKARMFRDVNFLFFFEQKSWIL